MGASSTSSYSHHVSTYVLSSEVVNVRRIMFLSHYSANRAITQCFQSLFGCSIATLNFSMGFNIIAPYMDCVTHK